MKRKIGTLIMTIGLLLLATALGLVGYNLLRDRKAGNESDARLAELQKAITKQTVSAQPENLRMFGDGQKAVPEMETLEIDAERYIGVLQIPDLELELPVMQDWNYENLTVAPCRYSGSCYGGDLVICAHNYGKHFSPIRNIEPGTDKIGRVDRISSAINSSESIRFRYFDYNTSAKKVYHRDGRTYSVSPFALIWDNENYYLLGYDEDDEIMKHFRVDKMESISSSGLPRKGLDLFHEEDLSGYSVMHFGMYHGELQRVRIRFKDRLAGQVIDRFGKDVLMIPDTEGWFNIDVPVAVSPVFFSWVFSFGTDAEIVGPENVRNEAAEYVRSLSALYED